MVAEVLEQASSAETPAEIDAALDAVAEAAKVVEEAPDPTIGMGPKAERRYWDRQRKAAEREAKK
jgi:isoaspartyl peptidase/L-asparaginase-like protein (Ntn-hydrolase superfamily)